MSSRHLLYGVLYRIGFTPWDGHPLATRLRDLIEGTEASPPLQPTTALDLGCGTGDTSIYLAQHGWHVTGVDFVAKPLAKARAKAAAAAISVNFVQGDVTCLASEDVGKDFAFIIIDNGCLHGMSDDDRDDYVREVTVVAAPDARLLIVGFTPGAGFGVRGIQQAEIERRFAPAWKLLASRDEYEFGSRFKIPIRSYLLERSH